MSTGTESRTPHFGLRDFLQYFLPGGVVLATIAVLSGIRLEQLAAWGNVGTSLLAIVVAYLLGHLVYPLNYPLRYLVAKQSLAETGTDDFKTSSMWVVETHPTFYATEVFRYRSLARFCIAMVAPSFFLGLAIAVRIWTLSMAAALSSIVLGLVSSGGFAFRYRRYHGRYRHNVLSCRNYPWKA